MPDPPSPSLAEKLDALFCARGDASLEDVARAIRAGGGPTISASSLWLLRTGRKTNPTLGHLEALAGYFGVPPGHFFDAALTDAATGDAEGLAALRDFEVRRLAVRAAGLSPRARRALVERPTRWGRRRRAGVVRRPERRRQRSGW